MILIPATKPEDWAVFLADRNKQWKDGYSAKSLAESWQNANDLPSKIKSVLLKTLDGKFSDLEMLIGIPEYKVNLPGGNRASQNDLFVLARTDQEMVSIMVEGKVTESFGQLVEDWREDASGGKKVRLDSLCCLLHLDQRVIGKIRYQILHRTASAILTANRYHCKIAMVLVHSFDQNNASFNDYTEFLKLYNLEAQLDNIVGPVSLGEVDTYWGWIADGRCVE
jgi:hypothetical protein